MDAYELAESTRQKSESAYHRMLARIVRDIRSMLTGISDPLLMIQLVNGYVNSNAFRDFAEMSARRMVTGQLVGQRKTWRAAASESMKGRIIYEALRTEMDGVLGAVISETIANNSYLIKTVPHNIALKMSQYAQDQQMKGIRPEEIASHLASMAPHLADYQIRRIARTESSKASTALTEARALSLGLDFYIWKSCEDERVRSTHSMMDGVLCRWSEPPNPERLFPRAKGHDSGAGYHPGNIYNCRCIALPVVDYNDLHFPIRAHVNNRIVEIGSLVAFEKTFGRAA